MHWQQNRTRYVCTDGVGVETPSRAQRNTRRDIAYRPKPRLCVVALADMTLSRDAGEVLESRAMEVAVLPRSVREVGEKTFDAIVRAQFVDMSGTSEAFAASLEALQSRAAYRSWTRVRLPGWLREIGERCFVSNGLTHFEVSASVEVIGKQAFAFCSSASVPCRYPSLRITTTSSGSMNWSGGDLAESTLWEDMRMIADLSEKFTGERDWSLRENTNLAV